MRMGSVQAIGVGLLIHWSVGGNPLWLLLHQLGCHALLISKGLLKDHRHWFISSNGRNSVGAELRWGGWTFVIITTLSLVVLLRSERVGPIGEGHGVAGLDPHLALAMEAAN